MLMQRPYPGILRSHMFWRVVVFTVVGIAFFFRVAPLVPFTGDEPHYVLGAISFINDGDFNVYNNYLNRDYREFGYENLRPQLPPVRPGVLMTEHGIGFPALLSIPWKLKKIAGIRYSLFFAALLTIFLVSRCCDLLSGDPWTGTLAALLIGFSTTWQLYARMVFPEVTAGFATAIISLLLIQLSLNIEAPGHRWRAFVLGLFLFFPAVYLRYAPLTLPLYLGVFLSPILRRMKWFYLGSVTGLLGLTIVLLRTEPGAVGPLAFGTHGLFKLTGAFDRFWFGWFDRNYGVAVFTPWVILAFWAVVYFLPRPRPFRIGYTESAAIAVLAYAVMLGLSILHPGASAPGRYPCSAIPLMTILVALWCRRGGTMANSRTVLAGALLCVSVLFVVVSIVRPSQPYFLFTWYTSIFQEYWFKQWDSPSPVQSSRLLGISFLVVLAATKLVAFFRARSNRAVTVKPFAAVASAASR
jgi:hypothetical protein